MTHNSGLVMQAMGEQEKSVEIRGQSVLRGADGRRKRQNEVHLQSLWYQSGFTPSKSHSYAYFLHQFDYECVSSFLGTSLNFMFASCNERGGPTAILFCLISVGGKNSCGLEF